MYDAHLDVIIKKTKHLVQVIDVDEQEQEPAPDKPIEATNELSSDEVEDGVIIEEQVFDCESVACSATSLVLIHLVAKQLLPNWHPFGLHPQLTESLHHNHFLIPTPIQSAAIPVALKQRDVVGVAQTVSFHAVISIDISTIFLGFW